MNLGFVAGEPSGDLLGAGLIKILRQSAPELTATGVGGPAMIRQGFQSLYEMEKLSMMGFIDPLLNLPELLKIRKGLHHYFLQHKPNVFIGIDSPDFNLGLELKLRHAGIPVVHYVSPSVWAWRQKRIHKISEAVDLVLTLFPFEADFYHKHHVPVCFVGHPLADLIPLVPDKIAARKKLNLDPDATYIALLPGSRRNEIKYLAEVFITAAAKLLQKKPKVKFITSAVNTDRAEEFLIRLKKIAPALPISFFQGCSRDVMEASDVVLVGSGTATLETMLFKRPMVIAYRMSALTFQLAKYLIKIPFFGLPNLLAKEKLVPELIQDEANPDALCNAVLDYLNDPEKVLSLEKKFTEMHQALRRDANQKAADAVLSLT